MYVNITGSKNNKDVYIYQSYRKANGKPSSHIYRKLGKYNDLLEQFSGDSDKLMAWAKEEAAKDTAEYNAKKENLPEKPNKTEIEEKTENSDDSEVWSKMNRPYGQKRPDPMVKNEQTRVFDTSFAP